MSKEKVQITHTKSNLEMAINRINKAFPPGSLARASIDEYLHENVNAIVKTKSIANLQEVSSLLDLHRKKPSIQIYTKIIGKIVAIHNFNVRKRLNQK